MRGHAQKTAEQLEALNAQFAKDSYISAEDCDRLGKEIGLSFVSVRNWFSGKRQKIKRSAPSGTLRADDSPGEWRESLEVDSAPGNISTASLDVTDENTPVTEGIDDSRMNALSRPNDFEQLEMMYTPQRKSEDQMRALKAQYAKNNYISEEDCVRLSEETGLYLDSIRHWFCNRRYRDKLRSSSSDRTSNFSPGKWMETSELETSAKISYQPKSVEQVKALKAQFARNSRPSKQDLIRLGEETGLCQKSIGRWIRRRRCTANMRLAQSGRTSNSSPGGWMESLEVNSSPRTTSTASMDLYEMDTRITDENSPIIPKEGEASTKKRASVLFRPYEIDDSPVSSLSDSRNSKYSEFLADQMENLKRAIAGTAMIWNSRVHGNPLDLVWISWINSSGNNFSSFAK